MQNVKNISFSGKEYNCQDKQTTHKCTIKNILKDLKFQIKA